MTAYATEDCGVLEQALEHAWEIFLKRGRLTRDNLDTAMAALAYCILQAAAGGERNPRRLAIHAVAHVGSVEPRIRLERSWSRAPNSQRAA
jgi:hypothetical protein